MKRIILIFMSRIMIFSFAACNKGAGDKKAEDNNSGDISAVLDYCCGRAVEKYRGTPKAKIGLLVSVIVNLSLLCLFKYTDFFIGTVNGILGCNIPLLNLPLPIGISFYTFQTMSYTIDVYRGDAKVQKNIISFGAYVPLFPQLIAGPIVRYQTITDRINERTHSFDKFGEGVKRFVCGLGKKVLLANNIGLLWSTVSKADGITAVSAWIGIIAFAFQIYFDFSGYSDMAIGLGKMFGFDFLENFDYPYCSKSITEFWRRWHISMGTWFRDYVYIPLGGNRKGLAVQLRNIAVVWLLTGFWHGANWNYVLWEVFYGAVLIFEKFFLLNKPKKAPAFVGRLYTLFCVAAGWVLFALEDLYGLKITELDGEVCLHLDKGMGTNYITMFEMFSAWKEQAEKYKNGEITKEEYDNWRYNYPESVAFNSRK